jgi:predicted transcriptional regulator
MSDEQTNAIDLAAEIVSAYVGNNTVSPDQLPNLIKQVHAALNSIGDAASEAPAEPQTPAVPVRKSVQPDHLVCLEDGRKFKSLKRHLRTKYDLSPEQYRAKWGLPRDYPMVAPQYAAARSALAKAMGLGQGGRQPAKAAPSAKRGRAKAAANG